MGNQAFLVWAMGSGGGGAKCDMVPLCDLQAVGTDLSGHLRSQRKAWPATIGGL